MIARRVVPVVLALAVALAPVALEACQVACAVHAMAAAGTGAAHLHAASRADRPAAHSCHDAVASTADASMADASMADASMADASAAGSAAVTSGPHDCRHSDELPVNAGALAQKVLHAPAVLRAPADLAPASVHTSSYATASFARASIPLALNLPLRV